MQDTAITIYDLQHSTIALPWKVLAGFYLPAVLTPFVLLAQVLIRRAPAGRLAVAWGKVSDLLGWRPWAPLPRQTVSRSGRWWRYSMTLSAINFLVLPMLLLSFVDVLALRGSTRVGSSVTTTLQDMASSEAFHRPEKIEVIWFEKERGLLNRKVLRASSLGLAPRIVAALDGEMPAEIPGQLRAAAIPAPKAFAGAIICLYRDGALIKSGPPIQGSLSYADIPGAEALHATCPATDAGAATATVLPAERSLDVIFSRSVPDTEV